MNDEIPESVDGADVALGVPWSTRIGSLAPSVAVAAAWLVASRASRSPLWWLIPLGAVVGLVVFGGLEQMRYLVRVGPVALETGPEPRFWRPILRPPNQRIAWHEIAAIEGVTRWWGRQVRISNPPVIRSPRELRSWRWLPDRSFDSRVALIRRTWLEAGPMPAPPPPGSSPDRGDIPGAER